MKSRILFEQMLGRGTRKGDKHPDKSHFTVFDCFDGSLLEYFRNATSITADPPETPSRTIQDVIKDIWDNRDRDYNIRCLVKRLQRIEKEMDASARELFASHGVADGDLGRYARELPANLKKDFTGTMGLLRDENFQRLLVEYPRKPRVFIRATDYVDTVSSSVLIRDGRGQEYKPEDYLEAFGRFVRENASEIQAIRILLDRPKEWSTEALDELRAKLKASPERFDEKLLQKAHDSKYHKLADIISMVKHAAREQEPLLTAQERVEKAFEQVVGSRTFSDKQKAWLDRIREHLTANLTIDQEDFGLTPVLSRAGGWEPANRAFKGKLGDLVESLNEAVAA